MTRVLVGVCIAILPLTCLVAILVAGNLIPFATR